MDEEDAMDTGEMESQSDEAVATNLSFQSSDNTFQFSSQAGAVQPLDHTPRSGTHEEIANMKYVSPISQQISMAEYNRQGQHLTQQALRDLKTSPEYKKHTMKCHRCHSHHECVCIICVHAMKHS